MGDTQLTPDRMNARALRCMALGLLLLVNRGAHADETLDEVVVSGEQPGPGLWQVKNGANTLWILGSHSPLP
jgi:hypothetical protein